MTLKRLQILLVLGITILLSSPKVGVGEVMKEIISERTRNAKVFDLGNGQRQAKVYSCPIHYKDVQGKFRNIDLSKRKKFTSDPLFPKYKHEINAGNYRLHFDNKKPWNYRMEVGDSWIEYKALFEESDNLLFKVGTSKVGVKESIILKNKLAPTILIWRIERYGNTIYIPDPIAIDAEGNDVPISVEWKDDNLIYQLDVQNAVYPVIIDPTTEVEASSDGTLYGKNAIYSLSRDADFSHGQTLVTWDVGQTPTTFYVSRSFCSFQIPTMTSISSCSLFLEGNWNVSTDEFNIYIHTSTYAPPISYDDYNDFDGWRPGQTHNGTVLNNLWNSADFSNDWNEIVFNQAGLDAVFAKKGDTLKLTLISEEDFNNSEPTNLEQLKFESSTTVDKEPYLSFTYSNDTSEENKYNVRWDGTYKWDGTQGWDDTLPWDKTLSWGDD